MFAQRYKLSAVYCKLSNILGIIAWKLAYKLYYEFTKFKNQRSSKSTNPPPFVVVIYFNHSGGYPLPGPFSVLKIVCVGGEGGGLLAPHWFNIFCIPWIWISRTTMLMRSWPLGACKNYNHSNLVLMKPISDHTVLIRVMSPPLQKSTELQKVKVNGNIFDKQISNVSVWMYLTIQLFFTLISGQTSPTT